MRHSNRLSLGLPTFLYSLLVVAALLTAQPLAGQEVSAGITGRVTHPSGAAVVNDSVTAKDVQRGTVWPTRTNEEGIYAFPRIPVGTYEIKVQAPGFKTATRSEVVLELNQRARLDISWRSVRSPTRWR